MTTPDTPDSKPSRKYAIVRLTLLILTLITSPFLCWGCSYALSALPGLTTGLFEAEVEVKNRSGETFYITPISTTQGGEPQIIIQPGSIRQRDLPLQPDKSILLTYDAADRVLSGIAVCRPSGDCRVLANNPDVIYLDNFEDLPELEPSWLLAIQSSSAYRVDMIIFPILGFVPVVLFLSWVYLGKRKKGNPAA